jgi:hypothetical protein
MYEGYIDSKTERFPCPCCGYQVYSQQPGSYQTCPICGWQDNLAQLRFPRMPNAANGVSLIEGQDNFERIGSAERRHTRETRAPEASDRREEGWRPVDPTRDNIEEPQRGIDYADSYPVYDTTVLYYWRPTYWRRSAS